MARQKQHHSRIVQNKSKFFRIFTQNHVACLRLWMGRKVLVLIFDTDFIENFMIFSKLKARKIMELSISSLYIIRCFIYFMDSSYTKEA